jgi:hypothetical protein
MREAIPIYEAYKRGDLEGLKALLGDPPPAGGGIGGITPGLAFAARLPTRAESAEYFVANMPTGAIAEHSRKRANSVVILCSGLCRGRSKKILMAICRSTSDQRQRRQRAARRGG